MANAKRKVDISRIDRNFSAPGIGDFNIVYTDVKKTPFVIEGLPWFKQNKSAYYRIPKKLTEKDTNEGIIALSNHTAGACVRFRSDSPVIVIRVKLAYSSDMNHMPRAGSAGFDSYCKPDGGKQLYNKTVQPGRDQIDIEALLGVNPRKGMCDWQVNLPLYGGVDTVEIGIVKNSRLEKPTPHKVAAPVLFYGSSITQGGCASRPGNAYSSMLCRAVDAPQVNLGFSGSARGEEALAREIGKLKLAAFVYDYDHNAPSAEPSGKGRMKSFSASSVSSSRNFRSSCCPDAIMPITLTATVAARSCGRLTAMRFRTGTGMYISLTEKPCSAGRCGTPALWTAAIRMTSVSTVCTSMFCRY